MKVVDHLERAKKALFSFEILPPLKGENIDKLFANIDPLMEFNPPFIDVTYHRAEFQDKVLPNGLIERKYIRKRPGTVGICAAIKNRYKTDPVPHIICGGFSKEETENALIDLNYLGIDNLLVIRGDSVSNEKYFTPDPNGHKYAIDLLGQVIDMNCGKYLDDSLQNATHSDFCVGVAGYPEKHFEAPNLNVDLKYLKMKIEKGAEYIVTQMFFDNKSFFNFVEQCRNADINVPIIPGMKPITTKRQLNILPSIFHIDLPDELAREVEKCKDNKQVREVGVEWGVQQSKELIEFGVPVVHYYSMGKADSVYRIARELF
jgi:methylenetetrahydrofolate reductase (NADPH)